MGSEPIKKADNKVMAILGWLGILGAIILIATGKKDEDPQLGTIFWQSLVWGLILFLGIIPFIGWIFYIIAIIMLIVGLIMAATGKVWQSPLVGGWAYNKAHEK
ncbi:MAG: hypothetical protein QCI82_00415 [Candidatus Thermoplasmatota archaeon]|nr:hypothetical protein [Candidatus Thermoplasmatota archaeon]